MCCLPQAVLKDALSEANKKATLQAQQLSDAVVERTGLHAKISAQNNELQSNVTSMAEIIAVRVRYSAADGRICSSHQCLLSELLQAWVFLCFSDPNLNPNSAQLPVSICRTIKCDTILLRQLSEIAKLVVLRCRTNSNQNGNNFEPSSTRQD